MRNPFEKFGLLVGRGPRNQQGKRPDQFVLEDLLVALGWIGKRHVSDGILAKYTGTGDLPPALLDAVMHRWHVPSRHYKLTSNQFEALCRLAVTEHFDPTICPVCRGTAEQWRYRKGRYVPIICPECMGTGHKPFSIRAKARALAIHKNTWMQRGIDRLYGRMLDSLHTWETHGRRKIEFYMMREHRRIE